MLVLEGSAVSEHLGRKVEDWKRAWDTCRGACCDDGEVPAADRGDKSKASCDLEVVDGVSESLLSWVVAELIYFRVRIAMNDISGSSTMMTYRKRQRRTRRGTQW